MMDFSSFQKSLSNDSPPGVLSVQLTALWYDAKGDWEKAHHLINDLEDKTSAWVHAYLHRKEGDIGNAGYWYRRAGRAAAVGDLKVEWEGIAGELLGR